MFDSGNTISNKKKREQNVVGIQFINVRERDVALW